MTLGVRVGLLLIRAYQLILSPFAGGACRFEPSCSTYALQAIETHGVLRGSWLALRRVARCHPLTPPGIDPVPPRPARSS
jgi:putative membrane protein insertion efficiency factor